MRPCRVCCKKNDSCVYASVASKQEPVLHSCCGPEVRGRYYCCPDIVDNVSFMCRGNTGRCQVVSPTNEDVVSITGAELLFVVCFVFLFMEGVTSRLVMPKENTPNEKSQTNEDKSEEKSQQTSGILAINDNIEPRQHCQSRNYADSLMDGDIAADWG